MIVILRLSVLVVLIALLHNFSQQQSTAVGRAESAAPVVQQYDPSHYLEIDKHIVPPKPLSTPQPKPASKSRRLAARAR
jgi:hypothetical protein